ncbi:hypothetical protein PG993_007896 [Apiospora rasikravindrae]|uniref:Uncharacterized protein n=1 Tax=Apiospora rasikravindrae TaxID=990691 RepID=A0ABR1T0J3_9PEZI
MAFHISDKCFLWPCPKCFKTAKKRYKKGKLEHPKQEKEKKKKKKPQSVSPDIQLINMDPNLGWLFMNQHPLMYAAQNEAIKGCDCAACHNIRNQAGHASKAAPPKPAGVVNDGQQNMAFFNIPHAMRHQHLQGPVQVHPNFAGHPHGNPAQHSHPHMNNQQQHLAPPGYNGVGVQNVYIWPCGVSHISFPIVDYTRSTLTAMGFPGPHFYMATLPNTAKVSDLVARLAPADSGKVLMARSHKGGGCFDATEATSVTSLQKAALQLEVWAKDDVDGDDRKSERVSSTSTNGTTHKKGKGKKSSWIPSPEVDNGDDKADEEGETQVDDSKSSTSSGDGYYDPDETLFDRLQLPSPAWPHFQYMGYGEGPNNYMPTINNPKLRHGRKSRKASSSDGAGERKAS